LQNLQVLLSGDVVPDSTAQASESSVDSDEQIAPYSTTPADSALRARVSSEDKYLLSVNQPEERMESSSQLYLFQPLSGMMSSEFDPRINHYGIDIVAPANSVIKSVLDGTVVFASWTSDGGYEIHIQHPYNLISVYKHNSVLLKSLGDKVDPGDAIAIIGDSGDHSDGPHLHFELWRNGLAIDPYQYFAFEQ
jgi:murein DD-endopeptidase MepM/ murein hydrolase activator NlpD